MPVRTRNVKLLGVSMQVVVKWQSSYRYSLYEHTLCDVSPFSAFTIVIPVLSTRTTVPNEAHNTAGSFCREVQGPFVNE